MFYQFGKLTVRFRWPIILFWAIVLILTIPFALRAASSLKGGFGEADTESRRALDILRDDLGITESSMVVVFSSESLNARDPRYADEVQRILSPMAEMPEVVDITTFYNSTGSRMVSDDGYTTFSIVKLDREVDEAVDLVPELREKLNEAIAPDGALKAWATGGIPIFSDLNRASERDLRRGEAISLPLVLVALILIFGGLVAAGLPVTMGAISVSTALATLFLIAQITDVSIFALNIVSFLGLGVAVDYSLLIVTRFREELEENHADEAVARTIATSGKALLFSGITSVLGLSGLLMFKFMMLRSIGLGGMLVILISFSIATTLLPAILSVLGHRVNRLSLIRSRPRREGPRFWHHLASWVMRHPFRVSIPMIAFLVLLGVPFLGVNIGAPWATVLPPEADSRQGWDVLETEMGPGTLSPIVIVARSPNNILAPDNIGNIYDILQTLQDNPQVDRVESLVTLDASLGRAEYQALYSNSGLWNAQVNRLVEELAREHTMVIRVFSHSPPMSNETKEIVRDIRSTQVGDNLELLVTGVTADLEDSIDVMYQDFPFVVLYVMAATYIALFFLFRSVLLPLKAILLNGLSIFASYGALVYIFQQGHFQSILGFQPEGTIESTIPILLFSIIFGLSMDYEVFLLSRVKEIYDTTGDNALSVAQGLERTGKVITSAALVLVLVAASFSTGDIIVIKALGLGTAIAIFLDATVVRSLLVPALMLILGDWNWWCPAFLRRLVPWW